ncbi:MAG: exodeoxyribonuclease VII small subunit [Chitinispirillaceae bacterium]
MKKEQSKKEQSFEESIQELEQIIECLEGDDLTLESALSFFEKGIKNIRTCDRHLENAQGKLRELLRGEDGEFVERVLGITLDSVGGGEESDD